MVMLIAIINVPKLLRLYAQKIFSIVPLSQIGYVIKNGTLGAVSAKIVAAINALNQFQVSAANLHGLASQSDLIHSLMLWI
jgi:hypothetical protein